MGKKKRSKKFNISNRLAYTLIIVLSIVLLGIGVYAYNLPPPTNVGHTANELDLDWGSVSSCTGTPTPCDSFYTYSTCNSQDGCSWGCSGGSFNIYCEMAHTSSECNNIGGCSWSSSSGCYGSGYDTFDCRDLNPSTGCIYSLGGYQMAAPCYPGCSGTVAPCSSYPTSTCSNHAGCSVTTIQRTITPTPKGIAIPNLNVGLLCDLAGTNCVRVIGTQPSTAGTYTNGVDSQRRIRENQWASCPSGSYVSSVHTEPYSSSSAMIKVTCTPLPIR